MSWIFFYRPMFMSVVIGLLPVEIGILITIFNLLTSVMPLLGGYLADRFGRKRVFMLFDSVCWLTSLIIWAISYNIWHALLAYVIEGCASVIYSVWECLLVEDTMWEFRSLIYGSISAIWTIGSLTTPIAGYIIGLYGLDMGCRLLFLLAFCALVPAYIIRQIYLREPEIGRRVREDGSFSGVKGYLNSLSLMRRSRTILTLLTIIVMAGFFNSSYAYFSLYLIHREGLELSENVASLIPSVSSIVSLTLSLMVVPRLKSSGDYFKTLISGYSLGSLAIFLLINSPKGLLSTALLSGALLGFYSTVAFSVSRAFLANQIDAIDERARAKILSVTITLSSLINLPTPTIVGYLFSLNPKIPFIIILATFLTSLLTLICSLRNQNIR
jgi:MFS family permease